LGTISGKLILNMFGESGWGLPDDVADRITRSLSLHVVSENDVSVCGCSSSRGDFPISVALNSREDEWWISKSGPMTDGKFEEYLEFSFNGMRRVSYVALKIPPLPHGPLSVRNFHILALGPGVVAQEASQSAWVAASPNPLQTLDRADLQEFALVPPCDTEKIRLVCTVNAAAAGCDLPHLRAASVSAMDCIGLFQVAFA